MSITPKAIQDLLDELEASKQSRLRAWNVLQRLRLVLSEAGNVGIPPPAKKTIDAEGEALEHALTKSFRDDTDERLRKKNWLAVLYPDTASTGSSDQLEYRPNSGCPCDPIQSSDQATYLGHFAVGPDSELGQRSKNRIQDHQREGRNH
jgi:hypothetical protein